MTRNYLCHAKVLESGEVTTKEMASHFLFNSTIVKTLLKANRSHQIKFSNCAFQKGHFRELSVYIMTY